MFLKRRLILVAAALGLCMGASAQNHGFGLFSSPKGFGLSYEQGGKKNPDNSYYFTLYADIYGLTTARAKAPGVKFTASKLYLIKSIETKEAGFIFYAGPGLTAGYAHDFEKGYWQNLYVPLEKNPGFIVALSGSGGCRIKFNRLIMLDLSLTIDAGMHIRKEEGSTKLSLYKNGLIQTVYPQLTIYTLF